jgi:hypothetical protein
MPDPAKPRRYPRLPLRPGPWVAVRGPGRTETYHCTSLGLGGVFLACTDPFPEGTVVRFALEIGNQTVRGIASVRDVTPKGMGLAFLSLSVNDRAMLHAYIDQQAEQAAAANRPRPPSAGKEKALDK